MCLCAVVSSADGWRSIADFGRHKLAWLRGFLPVAAGIPWADCFGWVTLCLPQRRVQEWFISWTRSVGRFCGGDIVAVDRKTSRRLHD